MNVFLSPHHIAALCAVAYDTAQDDSMIPRIKRLRELTGMGLYESKTLIEAEHSRRNPPAFDPIADALLAITCRHNNS